MRKAVYILLAFMTLSLASCNHKHLCLHHPHDIKLKVEFNWQNAPDANLLGMCVFFYPVDGGDPRRVDFKGTQGGYVELTVGKYHVLTYNNDTEAILFANGSFAKHRAYTREGNILEPVLGSSAGAPRASGTEEEKVVITPDMLWGTTSLDVEITDEGLCYTCIPFNENATHQKVESKEYVITLYPREFLCHYSYEIRNVQNLKHASQMCASLSGMSGGMTLASEELFSQPVTLPLEARINRENSTITGEFYTFGHHLENSAPHKMLLYVWMDSGEKYYFGADDPDFDVTSQVHSAPNPKRVHLIIDGLDLPKPIENGGGFKPTVDDWEEVQQDITM